MKYDYKFKLSEQDYLQYMRYMISTSSSNKKKALWMRLSLPALMGFSIYFFRLHTKVWIIILAVVLSLIWVFAISDRIWKHFLFRKINENFIRSLDIKQYTQVHVVFDEKCVKVDKKEIPYEDIFRVLPLTDILVVFHSFKESFVIPNRVIGNQDAIGELMAFIDRMIIEKRNASAE
ncbi:MAG: YcxB family protein [Erysipelotrichaceae bacterium]|nr:YcxB family protein [Erysipelotrichaceae bacterium]